MSLKKFKKQNIDVNISDTTSIVRVINTLQAAIEDSISPLVSNVANDSQLLTDVVLVAGKINIVNHKLGRKLQSWSAAPKGAAMIWDTQTLNTSPNLTLWLHVSADVTIDLKVW